METSEEEEEGKEKEKCPEVVPVTDVTNRDQEKCPEMVPVTDVTNSDQHSEDPHKSDQHCEGHHKSNQHSEEHHNSTNEPCAKHELKDEAHLSNEFQSSCKVKQTDFVETNGSTGDTINVTLSSEKLPEKEMVSTPSINNDKEHDGSENSPSIEGKSVDNIENGT